MNNEKETLIFVYNANSGLFSKATDFAHKIINPSTYECSLCSLTYGNFRMEKQWASFIENLDFDVQFSYKNKIDLGHLEKEKFPMLLIKNKAEKLKILLYSTEIEAQKNLESLIHLVENKLLYLKESK